MSSQRIITEAEEAIRRRFAAEGFTYTGKRTGKFDYDPKNVIENEHWWFIPMGWIGCMGFIVNKDDLYVNWLGSGLFRMDDIFWGHDHGIYCDMVDFTFSSETSLELAERIACPFKVKSRDSEELSFYPESEIPTLLRKCFPTIKNHFAWYAISEIKKAYEKEDLRFTCVLHQQTGE